MASILENLISDIQSFTAEQIERQITDALSAAQKAGMTNAAELAKYESSLREGYRQKEAQKQRTEQKKIVDELAKYSQDKDTKQRAQQRRAQMELEDELAAKRQSLEDRAWSLQAQRDNAQEIKEVQKQEQRMAREEARYKAAEERTERLQERFTNALNRGVNAINQGVEQYFNSFGQYYTDIETRLLGTGSDYNSVKDLIDATIGISGIVKQTDVLNKIVEFLEAGAARDVELRGVIATLSDKIAATFDALDPTLLSLGRILQQDTTVARLGMESSLTQFLNAEYLDTSYLTSNANVNTQAQLLDALSTMPADIGAEVEYAVQKWLGSFTAVGVSSDTISSVGQGIGYLGSGDISSLTSNTQLMNLLISAANRGGVDLSAMLTEGLTTNNVNALMQGLYSVAQSISESGNNVTRQAYASLFGMSLSDLAGFANLDASDISTILQNQMSYEQMEQQTIDEISQVASRVAMSTLLSNVYENVMALVGDEIATSPVAFATYQIADLITAAGGLSIPSWLTMGTGFSTLPDIDQLLKAGIAGTSLLANVGSIISSLNNGFEIDIDALLASRDVESTGTSTAISGFANATQSNTGATYIGDTSESSIYESSMAQVKDIVQMTGQNQEGDEEEQGATTGDINRLIALLERGIKVTPVSADTTISNLGAWGTVTFG